MAKIYGLFGALTGKLADTVMSVRNGEQIARKYQPVVFNPSTPGQVAQRAKMKLLSQLSAVMAPVIAIPRVGSVSSRNLFTKVNFPATTFASDTARVDLTAIQLTQSSVGFVTVSGSIGDGGVLSVQMSANVSDSVSSVAYAVFARQADDSLRFRGSKVVSDQGLGGNFETTFSGMDAVADAHLVVLAYGIRLNSDGAKTKFQNLEVSTADAMATLITTRQLSETDVTLTETKGVLVDVSE